MPCVHAEMVASGLALSQVCGRGMEQGTHPPYPISPRRRLVWAHRPARVTLHSSEIARLFRAARAALQCGGAGCPKRACLQNLLGFHAGVDLRGVSPSSGTLELLVFRDPLDDAMTVDEAPSARWLRYATIQVLEGRA